MKDKTFLLRVIIGTALSIFLVWVFQEKYQITKFTERLASVNINIAMLSTSFFTYIISMKLRIDRLRVTTNMQMATCRLAISDQFLLNHILPAKGGDMYRIFFVGRKVGCGYKFATKNLIFEKIFDLISIGFLTIFFYFLFSSHLNNVIETFLVGKWWFNASFFSLGIFLSLLVVVFLKTSDNYGGNVLFLSATIWFLEIVAFLFALIAIMPYLHLELGAYFLISAAAVFFISISLVIPAGPSGVGVFEGVVSMFLTLAIPEITNEQAFDAALVIHLIYLLAAVVLFSSCRVINKVRNEG